MLPALYQIWDDNATDERPLFWIAGVSTLWFGVAHAHHCMERIRQGQAIVQALMVTLVRLTYTSIFGFIAAILFLRTGTVFSPILSHVICNFMGLPNVNGMLIVPGTIGASRRSCLYPVRYLLLVLHVMGLILFTYWILPWTKYSAISSIYWK